MQNQTAEFLYRLSRYSDFKITADVENQLVFYANGIAYCPGNFKCVEEQVFDAFLYLEAKRIVEEGKHNVKFLGDK